MDPLVVGKQVLDSQWHGVVSTALMVEISQAVLNKRCLNTHACGIWKYQMVRERGCSNTLFELAALLLEHFSVTALQLVNTANRVGSYRPRYDTPREY